jgi:hypothetical protein
MGQGGGKEALLDAIIKCRGARTDVGLGINRRPIKEAIPQPGLSAGNVVLIGAIHSSALSGRRKRMDVEMPFRPGVRKLVDALFEAEEKKEDGPGRKD